MFQLLSDISGFAIRLLSDFYLLVGWEPYTWFAVLTLASAADAATTVYALHTGGFKEANPVMRWLISKAGIAIAMWLLKGMPLLMLYYTLQDNILFVPVGVLLFASVAAWNLRLLVRRS